MDKLIVNFIRENLLLSILFVTFLMIYILFEMLMYWYAAKTKFKLNCDQLTALLNHNNALIIDIRSKQEYESAHIINSINIEGIMLNDKNSIIHANADRPLIIVDAYGKTANIYASKLRDLNIREVWYLQGGLLEWQVKDLPLVSNTPKITNRSIIADIVLYTKKDCPYCLGAKNLLKSKQYAYRDIEVKDINTKEYQEMLTLSKGAKTFPQIFINNKHVGGFQELKELNDKGELAKII